MNCPVCGGVALVMSERQGIEIDYCPKCRGVWLDRGELDKILEKSALTQSDLQREYRGHQKDEYNKHHYGYKKRKKSFLQELFD